MELIITKFAELTNRTLTSPCAIVGKNGAGKSSIFNAYLWALTGKDKFGNEMNEAVYSIKDKDEDRYACVEVKFENVTFKRECRPIYMRESGTTNNALKSLCSMVYYLNGVKCKKSEYDFEVSRLCTGKDFRLFSDINYFTALKQADQLEIFMSLLNINREDYFKGMRDIKTIKSEIFDLKKDMRMRENWLEEEKRNFAKLEIPADYSEQITAKKDEIAKIQSQRPTLTAEQIAENNEISKKIAELERTTSEQFIPKTEKQDELKEARKTFYDLLNEKNNVTRAKMERDDNLDAAKKELAKTRENCEFDEANNATCKSINDRIANFEKRIAADSAFVENYDQHVKESSCGICPHCSDIFCEHRKNDIEPKAEILARVEQSENKIAELRANINELKEQHEQRINAKIATLTKQISDLESQTFRDVDNIIETLKPQIVWLEKEATEEAENNKTAKAQHDSETQKAENERARKIAELKAKIHIAQTASDDNRIYTLKIELSDLENKQRKADEQRGHRKGVADSIERQQEKMSEITLKQADLERELIDWENADAKYRKDIQTKANEILPDGMSVNLFRPLITGDGYESVFELKYTDRKYKNTALMIKGNFDLTRMFQQQFGVSLPIFVDDLANVTDEEFIPKGENIIQIVAVAAQPLEIVPLLN